MNIYQFSIAAMESLMTSEREEYLKGKLLTGQCLII